MATLGPDPAPWYVETLQECGRDPADFNIAQLRLVYVDCGTKDEFGLHWGARALVAKLGGAGVSPVYHQFDDGHMNISYRYDVSLPLLVRALA